MGAYSAANQRCRILGLPLLLLLLPLLSHLLGSDCQPLQLTMLLLLNNLGTPLPGICSLPTYVQVHICWLMSTSDSPIEQHLAHGALA